MDDTIKIVDSILRDHGMHLVPYDDVYRVSSEISGNRNDWIQDSVNVRGDKIVLVLDRYGDAHKEFQVTSEFPSTFTDWLCDYYNVF